MLHFLDLFGVAVFAVTGALAAGKKKMDLFGVVVLAVATALGGGTLRDVILGAYPVFWISNPTYIFVGTAAAVSIFIMARFMRPPSKALTFADAFGLAIFTVIGTEKAMSLGVPGSVAAIMGVMTGVAGGIIRDMLSGEIPLILKAEIYATASLCGAITFALLTRHFPAMLQMPALVAITVILVLRLAAIHWNLSLPIFPPDKR
ncbi:MAG TPA: trimeric intracellular cation channel family protein [Thermodesulfovibrionales bacterium]|nr:trimeric intracellular cation channel family protein [Thermodesulfovibrionales bacterium]